LAALKTSRFSLIVDDKIVFLSFLKCSVKAIVIYALLEGKEILKNVYFTGRVAMKRFLKCNFANLHLAVAKCSLKFMFNWFVLQAA